MSYWPIIVSIALSYTTFKICDVEEHH